MCVYVLVSISYLFHNVYTIHIYYFSLTGTVLFHITQRQGLGNEVCAWSGGDNQVKYPMDGEKPGYLVELTVAWHPFHVVLPLRSLPQVMLLSALSDVSTATALFALSGILASSGALSVCFDVRTIECVFVVNCRSNLCHLPGFVAVVKMVRRAYTGLRKCTSAKNSYFSPKCEAALHVRNVLHCFYVIK